jgi:hypothetical protein
MVLGAINTKMGYVPSDSGVSEKDLDFSPLELKVKNLENNQKYLTIALVILALYVILKK